MREIIRPGMVVLGVVLAVSLLGDSLRAARQGQSTNPHAAALADFQKRIESYRKLHDEVEKGPAEMKQTDDPARIGSAQAALAQRIRAARKDAKAGDIFTPEIRAVFRALMYPETHGADGRETKAAIQEDAPTGVPLAVNASYPADQPRPTVPPNVLANLPQLPKDLEYRIVKRHLVLLDANANLIVDFIPNVIR